MRFAQGKSKKSRRAKAGSPKINLVSIDDVAADPDNLRVHPEQNVDATDASMKRFGPARSIVLDGKNVTRAGNQTLASAKAAGVKKVLIVDAPEDTLVAVRRKEWTPDEAAAYSIADNRAGELSTWDFEGLRKKLDAISIDDFDFAKLSLDAAKLDTSDLKHDDAGDREGKEFDESAADSVKTIRCPNCGSRIPQ